ncbi:hypothetical protein [Streptomyces sp. SA15]|uniref:hypothetical protein n=1 Tax=Streptomyces sp. SA15 TaxID=934019 RepID=UPI0011802C23|nr:hypothetical protein [Streptomyces sp. SA15]
MPTLAPTAARPRPAATTLLRAATTLRHAVTGGAALLWTALVVIPAYWLFLTSLRGRTDFTTAGPPARTALRPAASRWSAPSNTSRS